MVDSIGGVGSTQNIQQAKAEERRNEKAERATENDKTIEDKVEISQEAQQLMTEKQAKEEAMVARQQLASDQSRSLGLDPSFDPEATA